MYIKSCLEEILSFTSSKNVYSVPLARNAFNLTISERPHA